MSAFHGVATARLVLVAQTAGDLVTPKIIVDRNDEYAISFWHLLSVRAAGTFRAFVREYNAADVLLATTNIDFTAVDATWTRSVLRFAPAVSINPPKIAWQTTTVKVEIGFNSAGASATLTVDVDAAQLERGSTPTAYAPMPGEIQAGSITGTQIADDSITTPKLVAEAVVSSKIAAGAISADKLAATIILGSLIRTGELNNRVEMDSLGFRVFNAAGDLLVNMPTDDSPVYINAEIVAETLTVLGNSTFRGPTNVLAQGAALVLSAQVEAPDQAPSLAPGWGSYAVPYDATHDYSSSQMRRYGLSYSAAGGAGGATKVFYTVARKGLTITLLEMLATTRAVNRSVVVTSTWIEGAISVVRHSTWIYVLFFDYSAFRYCVRRYVASSMALADTYFPVLPGSAANTQSPHLTSDGTNLFIVDAPDEAGGDDLIVKWNKYDAAMAKVDATIDGGIALDRSDLVRGAYAGSADLGAARMIVLSAAGAAISMALAAGTSQPNELFPVQAGAGGLTYGDAMGDGARFWHMVSEGAPAAFAIRRHTDWKWTTASSKYWVAYSWYDSVATVHETPVSPLASVTMGRRQQLTVTGLPVPVGGADEPDNRRVYIWPAASQPPSSSLKLQAEGTTPNLSSLIRGYDSGGAAPPVSNNFPAGTPSEIRSAGGEFEFHGDGTVILESGTYTPAVTGEGTATWTTREARWYRWGKLVFLRISLTVNAAGNGANPLTIALPFAAEVNAVGAGRPFLAMTYEGLTGLGADYNSGLGAGIRLTGSGDGAVIDRLRTANNQTITGASLAAAGFMQLSGWYETT